MGHGLVDPELKTPVGSFFTEAAFLSLPSVERRNDFWRKQGWLFNLTLCRLLAYPAEPFCWDDLLLSLLVAELDTNNSFLSGRTKEDLDWLAEDSQADSAPSSPRKVQLENRFFFAFFWITTIGKTS